ncbi:signal peptide peptidase SppA [Solilutibacter silvestris]|uniref:Signal peptide peptidase SppA n=1 Tax=Solilutibacter silvestris TaxID=1645665 RepID=A0A2K1Q0G7_9GAMM|nr:signal peptide peptidase SppA [Lysobacter silvestris]PNS08531.1 signal peptide peptidase SppA [Lysobacter silvestris]
MNQPVARRPNPVYTFFKGVWDVANFTRRFVLNIVFFALLFFVIGVLSMSGRSAITPVQARTTLVLAPEGKVMEEDGRDVLTRLIANSSEQDPSRKVVRLRDLIAVIDVATKDTSIERVFLDVDKLYPSGMASTHEITAALQRLKASGKQVMAFSEGMTQGQYLIAAQANQVYLDPDGHGLLLEGLSSYRPYMREGLQDKLGIDFKLFKVGEYKSAAEPFVRDSASPEAKEADMFWMNDLWQRYIGDIATARKLTPDAVKAGVDGIAQNVATTQGDLAKVALDQKLVDGLKTRAQVEDMLVKQGVADDDADGGFRQIGYGQYLRNLRTGLPKGDGNQQVAIVVAEGEIVPGKQAGGSVGGESTAELLRDARKDDMVKAVVLRVDSPGGEVFASEQIRREVQALKDAGKPVVVSMGDVAASGGYWISMNADRIYADPSTITGSIGIFGLIPNASRALGKIGVHTDGVGTTPLAGAMDITRPMDAGVATIIQSVIEKGYRDFTGKVALARKQPVQQIDAIARGRVWSGAQAKERGLVDDFGGLQAAIDFAASRARIAKDQVRIRYIERSGGTLDQLLAGNVESRIAEGVLARSPLLRGLAAGSADARVERQLNDLREQFIRVRSPVQAMAHCYCGFDSL